MQLTKSHFPFFFIVKEKRGKRELFELSLIVKQR